MKGTFLLVPNPLDLLSGAILPRSSSLIEVDIGADIGLIDARPE